MRAADDAKARLAAVLLQVALPFSVGAMIYLLFRETDLRVFQWAEFVGLSAAVENARQFCRAIRPPDFVVYSLPSALWLYAFTALMVIVWRGEGNIRTRVSWILLPLLVAAGSEGAQWLGLTDGTFDWNDVGLYVIGSACALLGMGWPVIRDAPANSQTPDLQSRHRLSFVCALCFSLIIGGADVVQRL